MSPSLVQPKRIWIHFYWAKPGLIIFLYHIKLTSLAHLDGVTIIFSFKDLILENLHLQIENQLNDNI